VVLWQDGGGERGGEESWCCGRMAGENVVVRKAGVVAGGKTV
jgi:hypothetical protein